MVYLDKDGNYIGRYILKAKEKKTILYESIIEVFVVQREITKYFIEKNFEIQKKYLLNESNFWKISDIQKYKNLHTVKSVYDFIVNGFSYDYSKINKNIKRSGADYALNNPNNVICTEFSDVFIGLSREKGIYSRELQGYGFSQNDKLRPLSLGSDILHSWPQYFDLNNHRWISVDPTWENTSGIDYFSSFDLNHIIFAIHGYKPDYPLPAGMYKFDDSKDINITTTSIKPAEITDLEINKEKVPNTILKNSLVTSKITLINKSNVFLYDMPLLITSDAFDIKEYSKKIQVIAPYEKKEIYFSFTNKRNAKNRGLIRFNIPNIKSIESEVEILNTKFYLISSLAFIIVFIVIFIIIKYRKKYL